MKSFRAGKKRNELLFVSGQLAIKHGEECVITSTLYDQTVICLQNSESVIYELDLTRQSLLKITLCLTDVAQLNEVSHV